MNKNIIVMKRLRTILAAVLIAASVAFSACTSMEIKENSTSPKTAYVYSVTGDPIDTIENIVRFYRTGEVFQFNCSDGSYVYTNQPVIVK